jgi:hypothetical protein
VRNRKLRKYPIEIFALKQGHEGSPGADPGCLRGLFFGHTEEHSQEVRAAVENLWEKYGVSLEKIQGDREQTAKGLNGFLKELGYA